MSTAESPRVVLPELSIVLPCYRAAPLALQSVCQLREYLRGVTPNWEIIVVDDGGNDFDDWSDDDPRVRLVQLARNHGKGAAIRAGMRTATGRARVFTDVDLPFDLDLLPIIAGYVTDLGFHVVVGDRTLPNSSYLFDVGFTRRIASQLFSFFVGKLVTGGFFDTQCGLKGFRGDVAEQLFALTQVDRFACDVELIYVALIHRLDIKRIPVRLRRNETSSVRVLRDSVRMLLDVFRMKYYRLRGVYRSARLESIVREDFERCRHAALVGRTDVSERQSQQRAGVHAVR